MWNVGRMGVSAFALLAAAVVLFTANDALAGVKGKNYLGSTTAPEDFVGDPLFLSFTRPGPAAIYQEFFSGKGLQTFQGSYSELDLLVISFVQFNGEDGSGDAVFEGSGVSLLLGTVLIMNYSNPDGSVDWSGLYFRTSDTGLSAPKVKGRSSGTAGPPQ